MSRCSRFCYGSEGSDRDIFTRPVQLPEDGRSWLPLHCLLVVGLRVSLMLLGYLWSYADEQRTIWVPAICSIPVDLRATAATAHKVRVIRHSCNR